MYQCQTHVLKGIFAFLQKYYKVFAEANNVITTYPVQEVVEIVCSS